MRGTGHRAKDEKLFRMVVTYSTQRSSEKKDVGLGSVTCVVLPSAGLLNTQAAPLSIGKGTVLWDGSLGSLLGKDDVSVLELPVLVLLGIVNLQGNNK